MKDKSGIEFLNYVTDTLSKPGLVRVIGFRQHQFSPCTGLLRTETKVMIEKDGVRFTIESELEEKENT